MTDWQSPLLTKRQRLADPYVTAGDRAYLIGTQDGDFPDLGDHLPGEMGGLWAHPIKLLDGFWLQVDGRWLPPATAFHQGPLFNSHTFELSGLTITRRQWVPDGLPALVVSFQVEGAPAHGDRELTLGLAAHTDLRPVWLGERSGWVDAPDEGCFDAELQAAVVRDRQNPWWVVIGTDGPVEAEVGDQCRGPRATAGQGTGVLLRRRLRLEPGTPGEVRFYIAGSYRSREEAVATFCTLREQADQLFRAKAQRYAAIDRGCRLTIPDEDLTETFRWVKYNYDQLIREVPEQGRGLGAGLPEYPWWFGTDNSYALLGLLPLGPEQQRLAIATLDLLAALSWKENGNGRIIHEATTAGTVYHPGNTQETPHFCKAVYHVYRWSGDREFLRRVYPLCKEGVLGWLLGQQAGPDGLARGYGIIEIDELNVKLLDTAVYTYEALIALAELAPEVGEDPSFARNCLQRARQVKEAINTRFWLPEEGLYADMLATPAEMLPRLERWEQEAARTGRHHALGYLQALKARARSLPPDEEVAWLLKNWIVNTPLEAGLASPEQARQTLERMALPEFRSQWGLYLSGLYRDHVMTISTGVQAVAEAVYGRPEAARDWLRRIAATLNLRTPGSPSEMSPDYGCFVQAWTGYGLIWPLVVMLGLQPDAARRQLHLRWPCLPQAWEPFAWEQVAIGDSLFDFRKEAGRYQVRLQSGAPWQVTIPVPEGQPGLLVNGRPLPGPTVRFELDQRPVTLEVE